MKVKKFLIVFNLFLIFTGIFIEPSMSILQNYKSLIMGSDALISDYFIKGSIGSAFLNAGLVGMISIVLMVVSSHKFNVMSLSSVMLMSGFAFFGKNIVNIWPIIFGVYLYTLYQKKDFGENIPIALFATSFSPIVSEFLFVYSGNLIFRIALALALGISIGFVIVFFSNHIYKIHKGYNLYNVGFAIGLLSTLYVSLMKSYGYVFESELLWDYHFNLWMYGYFSIIFLMMVIIGLKEGSFKSYKELLKSSGYRADYLSDYGFSTVILNMGVNGLFTLAFLYMIKVPLNGPVIGGLLTILGFSGNGKHIRNMLPIFVGVYLGSVTKVWSIQDPSIVLSALFGTGLAPLAGSFGFLAGAVASYLNSSVVLNTGFLHGGLNLYNTGFAIGIVCALIVPLYEAISRRKKALIMNDGKKI